ncbi:MAG: zinc ribbon domain-containing protein [Clostridia bacterium]|nr:zinc ribbon domain-containing protein [Clostridia bacterium]
MFCKFCGKEILEGSSFCTGCGKSVENTPVEEQATTMLNENDEAVAEAPAEEVLADEAPAEEVAAKAEAPAEEAPAEENQAENATEQSYFAEPQFDAPAKKPNKKLIAIISAIAAILLIGAAGVITCFGAVEGFFIKTFGSDTDYFMYVESKAFDSATDKISEGYGTALDNFKDSGAAEMSLKLNVGEKAISLLEDALDSYSDSDMDLAWLDTVTLDMNANIKDDIEKIAAALNINEKTLVDLDFIMDMDKGEAFIALLSLSDKYLKAEIPTEEDYVEVMDVYSDPELKKLLPSEKELDKMLDKYIKIVLENLVDVEKSSDILSISDMEQKLTALEVEIHQEDAVNAISAVLEAAKDDTQIKKYIEDIAEYLANKDIIDDADEAYDDFCDAIDDIIDEIEDEELDDDAAITWIDYVNADHEIVGRKIEVDDEEILYYATVRDGKKFAFELESSGIEIEGDGTEKGDIVNGEYSVKGYDEDICDVIVSDFKTNDDYLNGNFRIEPSSELLTSLGLDNEVVSALSIASPKLELNFDNDKNSGTIDFNLMSGDEIFVGFTFSAKETKAKTVEVPNSKDVYDEDEIEEWAEGIDTDALLEKLEDVGISSDLIDTIESLFTPSYDYGYNYGYDFDYGYDSDYDFDFDYDFDYDYGYDSDLASIYY